MSAVHYGVPETGWPEWWLPAPPIQFVPTVTMPAPAPPLTGVDVLRRMLEPIRERAAAGKATEGDVATMLLMLDTLLKDGAR